MQESGEAAVEVEQRELEALRASTSAEIDSLQSALQSQKVIMQGDLDRCRMALKDGEEVTRALREALASLSSDCSSQSAREEALQGQVTAMAEELAAMRSDAATSLATQTAAQEALLREREALRELERDSAEQLAALRKEQARAGEQARGEKVAMQEASANSRKALLEQHQSDLESLIEAHKKESTILREAAREEALRLDTLEAASEASERRARTTEKRAAQAQSDLEGELQDARQAHTSEILKLQKALQEAETRLETERAAAISRAEAAAGKAKQAADGFVEKETAHQRRAEELRQSLQDTEKHHKQRVEALEEEHAASMKTAREKASALEDRLEESIRDAKKKTSQMKQITDQLSNVSSASEQLTKLQVQLSNAEAAHAEEVRRLKLELASAVPRADFDTLIESTKAQLTQAQP